MLIGTGTENPSNPKFIAPKATYLESAKIMDLDNVYW